jgi:hypothetical protein
MKVRWDKERDIGQFAVLLQFQTSDGWKTLSFTTAAIQDRTIGTDTVGKALKENLRTSTTGQPQRHSAPQLT